MRTYIPCYKGSVEKVSLTKNNSKTWLMFFIIPFISFSTTVRQVFVAHIIKEVDISEELYSQQLIYR